MRRSRRLYLAAAFAAAAFAACALNPQPLPPGEEGPNAAQDGPGARIGMDASLADAAGPVPPNHDANAEVGGDGGGSDAGSDAGFDAGSDAGDAGTD